MKRALIASAVAVSVLLAQSGNYEKRFLALSDALVLLTSAIENAAHGEAADANMSDEAFLNVATRHNPALREPFRDFQIKIFRKNRHAIVLVCTKDGTKALFEDAGCTAEMDAHLWMPKELPPCTFHLTNDFCQHTKPLPE